MSDIRIILRSESDWNRLRSTFSEVRNAPLLYEVVVREVRAKRSIEQNARYWALLNAIADFVEDENSKLYSPETWHEYFKTRFIGKDVILVDGEPELIAKSTTKLTIMEFGDYMQEVEVWAVEHNVEFQWTP